MKSIGKKINISRSNNSLMTFWWLWRSIKVSPNNKLKSISRWKSNSKGSNPSRSKSKSSRPSPQPWAINATPPNNSNSRKNASKPSPKRSKLFCNFLKNPNNRPTPWSKSFQSKTLSYPLYANNCLSKLSLKGHHKDKFTNSHNNKSKKWKPSISKGFNNCKSNIKKSLYSMKKPLRKQSQKKMNVFKDWTISLLSKDKAKGVRPEAKALTKRWIDQAMISIVPNSLNRTTKNPTNRSKLTRWAKTHLTMKSQSNRKLLLFTDFRFI